MPSASTVSGKSVSGDDYLDETLPEATMNGLHRPQALFAFASCAEKLLLR